MSHAPIVIDHAAAPASSAIDANVNADNVWAANLKAALIASLLAFGLLYGMGFAPLEALHNAAHDSRHSAGFPCH